MRTSTALRIVITSLALGGGAARASEIVQAGLQGNRLQLTFSEATNRYIVERFEPGVAASIAVGTSSGVLDHAANVAAPTNSTAFFRIRAGLQAVQPADSVLQGALRAHVGAGKMEPTNWLYDVELAGLTNLSVALRGISTLAGLAGLADLTWFDAGGNAIENVDGLADLPDLRLLRLDGNRLASLNGVEAFAALEVLDVSHNALTSLAPLAPLTQLTVLYADQNQLTSLDGLENLLHLHVVDLSGNQLTSLAPLLANAQQGGLGPGDLVYLTGNTALDDADVAALRAHGVTVLFP